MDDMNDNDDDIDDDDDDSTGINIDANKQQKLKELTAKATALEEEFQQEDGSIDPAREDMRDGFFDLHEMEEFADEEEEMLPDEAYGDDDNELPVISGANDDEDDEEEEDNEPLSKRFQPTTVRRKKYRADDEVNALCELV